MMNENMLPVGTLLKGKTYEIEKQLSSGGFGNTYVVRNMTFDELFAMKEFFMKGVCLRHGSKVTVTTPDNKATFESQRKKFMKEARRLRKLSNKHIVKVHDLFEDNGTVYYVMDLINGLSLADIVKRNGPMDELMAMSVFRQMLGALRVIHAQEPKILHLDIKPSNIMLDKSGNAFLLDFGSSKQIESDGNLTTISSFTLSSSYAPSELLDLNKKHIGPWTDLYELGATLYNILTGHQPPSVSEIVENGYSAFDFSYDINEKTRTLILWLMSTSRQKRPKSVAEVYRMLEETIVCKGDDDETIYRDDDNSYVVDDDETIYSGDDESDRTGDDDTVYNEYDDNEDKKQKAEKTKSDDDLGVDGCIFILLAIVGAGFVAYKAFQFISSFF